MRRGGIFVLGIMAMLLLSGCELTGGGWMTSANGVKAKASFGFDLTCNVTSDFLNGDWVYHDKAAGVDVNGTLTDTGGSFIGTPVDPPYTEVPIACDPTATPPGVILLPLLYTAQHCSSNCTGHAIVEALDTGHVGPSKGDQFSISILDGPFAGYQNAGTLQGGNLTVSGTTP